MSDNLSTDNTQDARYSVVTIIATQEQQEGGNFLLELTSALNGVGVKIGRAVIQSCKSCGTPVADADFPADDEHSRLYKVWGTDRCVVSGLRYNLASACRVVSLWTFRHMGMRVMSHSITIDGSITLIVTLGCMWIT